MASLPDVLGNDVSQQPSSHVATYDPNIVNRAIQKAGSDVQDVSREIAHSSYLDAAQDGVARKNQFDRQMISTMYGDGTPQNPGLLSLKGLAAKQGMEKFQQQAKDYRDEALNGVTNPLIQNQLTSELDSSITSHQSSLGAHIMEESRTGTLNLFSDTHKNLVQQVALNPNDRNLLAGALNGSDHIMSQVATMNGAAPGDATFNATIAQGRTALFEGKLTSQLKSKDPAERAAAYDDYEKNLRPMMSPEGVQRMDAMFEPALPQIFAQKAVQDWSSNRGINELTVGDLYNNISVNNESGGKQFGGVGSVAGPNDPTTSPKGAIGSAQIMPATGPEAAKLAGVAWDPERFKNDKDYSDKLGKAYLGAQIMRFGDNRLAIAAYNAGPTIIEDWMKGTNNSGDNKSGLKLGDPRTGEVSVDQFISQMPYRETRLYVANAISKAGPSSVPSEADIAAAAKLQPQMYQKEFLDMATVQRNQMIATRDQKVQGVMDQVDKAFQNGESYSTFPVDLRYAIKANGLEQNYQNYNPKAPSNPDTWTYLNSLDPAKLAKINLNTPSVRTNLSPQDYQQITQRQSALSNPQALMSENDLHAMVRGAAGRMGISIKEKYDYKNLDDDGNPTVTVDGNQDFIRMMDLAHQGAASYAAKHNGAYPEGPEMQKIVDGAIMAKVKTGSTTWHFIGPSTDDTAPAYSITIDKVPPKDVIQIKNTILKNGGTPTDQNVVAMYVENSKGTP